MLPALPIIIPLLTACVCLLFGHRARLQRALAVLGACGLLVAAITLRAGLDRRRAGAPRRRLAGATRDLTRRRHACGPDGPGRRPDAPRRECLLAGQRGCPPATLRLLRLHEHHADGRLRRLPDGRPVQSLRVVRGDVDRQFRTARTRRRSGADGGRHQIRHAQPAQLCAVPRGGRCDLRHRPHVEHGALVAALGAGGRNRSMAGGRGIRAVCC